MSSKTDKDAAEARVSMRHVRRWVNEGVRFPLLTCYDATTAGWLWRGGVKCLLVGDTAAQFILGHKSTLPVRVPIMIELTAAVRRGAPQALIMGDMPFGSYQCGEDRAVRNAVRFITRGKADVVKMEVDASYERLVRRLSSAGVPVVVHLGSLPQHKLISGSSSRMVYRSDRQVAQTVEDAGLLVDAGAVMVLLEAVPNEVAQGVVEAVVSRRPDGHPVPVIGCGAGPACHGHVVVLQDLLGLSDWQPPFAQPLAVLGPQIQEAAGKWRELVESGRYLQDHPYRIQRETVR